MSEVAPTSADPVSEVAAVRGGPSGLLLSVVIPTYRRGRAIVPAVSAAAADPDVAEVIVVDDGSGDSATSETLEWLGRNSPKVLVVTQPNCGPAAARMTGIKRASCPYVLLLDDDVVASPGLGRGHLAHHLTSEVPLVVVGYMPVSRSRVEAGFATKAYSTNYERVCDMYERTPDSILDQLWGGNLSVRRDALESVPVVPNHVLPYHEDRVLGWYLKAAGCRGRFDRSLHAEHLHDRSLQQYLSDCFRSGVALARLTDPTTEWLAVEPPVLPPLRGGRCVSAIAGYMRVLRPVLVGLMSISARAHLHRIGYAVCRVLGLLEAHRGWRGSTQ